MSGSRWIAIGALWAALGVGLGAFGAHGLRDVLEPSGELANWETAVRYQVWHALALVAFGLDKDRRLGSSVPGLLLLVGSACFSGSIYALTFDVGSRVVWPLTPLGGLTLIAGWVAWALAAWSDD